MGGDEGAGPASPSAPSEIKAAREETTPGWQRGGLTRIAIAPSEIKTTRGEDKRGMAKRRLDALRVQPLR